MKLQKAIDFSSKVSDSGGQYLYDLKNSGILFDKAELLTEDVPSVATKFILENYDLNSDDLLLLRIKVLSHIRKKKYDDLVIEGLKNSLSDALNDIGFSKDAFFDNSPLKVKELLFCVQNNVIPPELEEYKANAWEIVSNIVKNFNEENDSQYAFGDFTRFVEYLIPSIDFEEDPKNAEFLDFAKKINKSNKLNAFEKELLKNNVFVNRVAKEFSGEDFNLKLYTFKDVPIDNKLSAKFFLSRAYKGEYDNFLSTSGTVDFPEHLKKEMAKNPVRKKELILHWEKLKKKYLEDIKEFGEFGTFIFTENNDHMLEKIPDLMKFLTKAEINEITKNNWIPLLEEKGLSLHLHKIQESSLRTLNFHFSLIKNNPSGSVLSSLAKVAMFLPEGLEHKVFTPEFNKRISDEVLGFSSPHDTAIWIDNSWGGRFFAFTKDGYLKVMRTVNSLLLDPEAKVRLSKDFFSDIVTYTVKVLNDNNNTLSNKEYNELLSVVKSEFEFLRDHFDISKFNSKKFRDRSFTLSNELFGSENNLLDKEQISVQEAFFLLMVGANSKDVANKVSSEDIKDLKALYFLDREITGNENLLKYKGSGSFETMDFSKASNDSCAALLVVDAFRDSVLANKLRVLTKESVDDLISDKFADFEFYDEEDDLLNDVEIQEDNKNRKEMMANLDEFFVKYSEIDPFFLSNKNLIFFESDGLARFFPKSIEKASQKTVSASAAIELLRKSGERRPLEAILNSGNTKDIQEVLKGIKTFLPEEWGYVFSHKSVTMSTLNEAGFPEKCIISAFWERRDENFLGSFFEKFDTFSNSFKHKMGELLTANINCLSEGSKFKSLQDVMTKISSGKVSNEMSLGFWNFMKEFAPMLLTRFNHEYGLPLSLLPKVQISDNDVVRAVKKIADVSFTMKYNCEALNKVRAFDEDVGFSSLNWGNIITQLNDEEKLFLIRDFSNYSVDAKYSKEIAKEFFENPNEVSENNFHLKELHVKLAYMFKPEFINKNKHLINNVFGDISKSLSFESRGYNLGDYITFFKTTDRENVKANLIGSQAWADCRVSGNTNRFFYIINEVFLYPNVDENYKVSIIKELDLSTKDGALNFFKTLSNSGRAPNKTSFNSFFQASTQNLNEEGVNNLISIYDKLSLMNYIPGSAADLFVSNPIVKDFVNKARVNLKVKKSINNIVFQEDLNDELDFKM